MVQTLPLRSGGARAGPSALRFRRKNPTSCILTLGHYNTFQMDVQKPTLSGSWPLAGPRELTRRGQAKPEGNAGHQGKAAPAWLPAQCLGWTAYLALVPTAETQLSSAVSAATSSAPPSLSSSAGPECPSQPPTGAPQWLAGPFGMSPPSTESRPSGHSCSPMTSWA